VSVDRRFARRLEGITDGPYESVDSGIDLEHEAILRLSREGGAQLLLRPFPRAGEGRVALGAESEVL
jgi:hypothetical protein